MVSTLAPLEGSGVNDDTAKGISVSAHPLGETVNDNVSAVLDGIGQIRGREGSIDHQGNLDLIGILGNFLQVDNLQGRVGHSLAEECASLVVRGGLEAGGIRSVNETNSDAHGWENVVEHGVGSTVELTARNNVVTGLADIDDTVEDSGSSRGEAKTTELVSTL